jgi:hypothetical protein
MPGLPGAYVAWYPSADCSEAESAFSQGVSTASQNWQQLRIIVVAPAGTHSAQLRLNPGIAGSSGSFVEMEYDSAVFGVAGTVPVTLQSFSVE